MAQFRYSQRPYCQESGCYNLAAMVRDYHDGWADYRKWCSSCHSKRTAAKHGLKYMNQVTAKNAGCTVTEYKNQFHPYRKYRRDYCENRDGRLGFFCTTNIVWDGMLDVDHINGDPSDHSQHNLQTLCKCCHAYKTVQNKDYQTPGRKELGLVA